MDNKRIFVIIPAYNEAKIIGTTLQPILVAGFSIVVVDDGSTDETWNIVRQLPIYSLRHPINLGQGAALQTGMTFALLCNAEVIVHFDADGQHDAKEIVLLATPVLNGTADVVFGSRFLRPADTQQVPIMKIIVLKMASVVNGIFTGIWLTDAHNGFRALSRKAAEHIQLRENGFAHASEILIRVREHKFRYTEQPTHITYSNYSRAKGQSIWNAFNLLIDLLIRRVVG